MAFAYGAAKSLDDVKRSWHVWYQDFQDFFRNSLFLLGDLLLCVSL